MKNLVVLSDGTWQREDQDRPTNVGLLRNFLAQDEEQKVFYDPGVGTGILKLAGGAFGWGIGRNIKECYNWLVMEYEEGDKIFLFGFSRGATTVRSLAGFIGRFGLVGHPEKTKKTYSLYRNQDPNWIRFKHEESRPVEIEFLGVWDTVGALGIPQSWHHRFIPNRHRFHDTRLSKTVKFGAHAVSIEERRKSFVPILWDEDILGKIEVGEEKHFHQEWFPGHHADIGGGAADRELSDCALQWMLLHAGKRGLRLDSTFTIAADACGSVHDPCSGFKKIMSKERRIPPKGSVASDVALDRFFDSGGLNYLPGCQGGWARFRNKPTSRVLVRGIPEAGDGD